MIYLLLPIFAYLVIGAAVGAVAVFYVRTMRNHNDTCKTAYAYYMGLPEDEKALAYLRAGATLVFLWLPIMLGKKVRLPFTRAD